MWKRICQLLGIKQLLSTAFHPQTDRATERANAVVETYLCSYVCYDQGDWEKLIPIAELAINTRTSSATRVSPFYLTHGYDLLLFGLTEDLPEQSADQSPIQIRENIAHIIKEAMDWAKASLAYSQQEAEYQANKK